MRTFNLKKLAAVSAFGLVAILGTTEVVNAQDNRRNDQKQERKIAKQQEKLAAQRVKVEQQRVRMDQQRQAEWTRRNTRIIVNDRSRRVGPYNGNVIVNTNSNRYRVYRNGSYYNTDNRGAELLRQAVNEGYRQGFKAGRADRDGRRNSSWSNSSVYRNGTSGYQSHVNRSQYQYYFRQGFQHGYQDGSNSRYQEGYSGSYEYGSNDGGTLNILGTILNRVLNIQSY